MAINTKPIFGGNIETNVANITTAKNNYVEVASPSDAVDFRLVFTAGASGGFIDEIKYKWISTATPSSGTPNAAVLFIWITDSSGANARVVHSYATAVGSAMSTTVAGAENTYSFRSIPLKAGQKVFMSVSQIAANTSLNVIVHGGQFEAQ